MIRLITIAIVAGGFAAPIEVLAGPVERAVKVQLTQTISDALAEPDSRVQVRDVRLTPTDLAKRAIGVSELRLTRGTRGYGRVVAEATLQLRGGRQERAFVSARVEVEVPVWVARQALRRGDPIEESVVSVEHRSLARLPRGTLRASDSIDGRVAGRSLLAGAVLTEATVETPELVRRGETVTVVVTVGAVIVRGQGEALRSGRLGDRITVRTGAQRRVVTGVVEGSRRVRLER